MKVLADFTGVFGDLLCLSHSDVVNDEKGRIVFLAEGMEVTAFDLDSDEKGNRDNLIASGKVTKSPDWLRCNGSKWALKIDEHGIRHESEIIRS